MFRAKYWVYLFHYPRLSAAVRQSAKKLELNPNQLFYFTEYGFLTDNRREQKQLQLLAHDVSAG